MEAGGSNAQILQREGVKYIEGVEEPALIKDAVRNFANVRGVSAVLRGNVQVTSPFKTEDAQIFGIKLDEHRLVSELERKITTPGGLGKFLESTSGVLVGRVLADHLQLTVNDSIVVNARGESRRYHVAAILRQASATSTRPHHLLDLGEARSLLRKPTGATFVQISLYEPKRAREEAAHMENVLGHGVSREEREKEWLSVFRALKVSSAITVTVFTLIASLAMFNTLAMIVLDQGYRDPAFDGLRAARHRADLSLAGRHRARHRRDHRRALRRGGDVWRQLGAVAHQYTFQDGDVYRLVVAVALRPGNRDGRGDGDDRESRVPHAGRRD